MAIGLKNFNANKIIGAFSIYLLGSLILKGVSFITTPIFTRILSTEEYGVITIFLTWASFFAVFIGLQISGSIATAYVHRGKENFMRYMKSIVILSLCSAIILSSICLLFSDTISSLLQVESNLMIHLVIQAYGLSCATVYAIYTIQTKQPKQNVIFSVVVTLLIVGLSMALILTFDEEKYLGRIYASSAIYLIVIFYVVGKFVFGNKAKVNLSDWKYSIMLGSPLIIHLLANIIIGQSDRIYLKSYIGLEAAAIYSVCYNISIIGMIFAEVGNKVWSPWYLENTKNKNDITVDKAAAKFSLAIAIVFVVVMFVSPEVLVLMAPEEYWVGKSTLLLITASIYYQFLYRFPLTYEQFSQNMNWVAVSTITAGALNLGLNYFFIDYFGMIGAAIASYISYVALFLMHEFVARKILKGYNIKMSSYIPGIVIVTSCAVVTYFLLDYWYLRYGIILVLFLIGVFLFFKKRDVLTKFY
ncbi:MAG: O-antigen/teichoic acid export membrane protein [Polaribacter sp.]|jgi:O-antigen/teichoic acid export membrane protein